MTVYMPSKSLLNIIKSIEKCAFKTSTTFIITGKNGSTGKTYLTNLLKKKGFSVIEITEDLLGIVSYVDDKNHIVLNRFEDVTTVILNEPLIRRAGCL